MDIVNHDFSKPSNYSIDKYVILESMEGHQFYIEEECAKRSGTLKLMLESQGPFIVNQSRTLTFNEISKPVLEKVCQYLLYKHHYLLSPTGVIPEFPIPDDLAVDLVIVANFLDC
ncbi:Transcription elongation factor B polypeptide 1 [Thelohanellus kitauei]|uniref:Elongin-C n=1 Tax=Thelohanellus kitauei TaxID=669202 RepID=A0A0C2MMU8_THEKT|nr:Transcription elongation factor B polypeptide 1 [Thelohanellus kitauei]